MRRTIVPAMLAIAMVAGLGGPACAGHSLGVGVEYLRTVGDIKNQDKEFDVNDFGVLASYRYRAGLLGLELEAEWVPDYGKTNKDLFQPQAFFLVGGLVYAGAGIGFCDLDGEWQKNPFYSLRAGVDLPLGAADIDIFGLYRFEREEVIEHFGKSNLDAVTISALIRFNFGR